MKSDLQNHSDLNLLNLEFTGFARIAVAQWGHYLAPEKLQNPKAPQ